LVRLSWTRRKATYAAATARLVGECGDQVLDDAVSRQLDAGWQ
jgi:hypothetical protein